MVLILPPGYSEEEQNKLLTKVSKLIETSSDKETKGAEKGRVVKKTSWGKKTFSYPVAKNAEGIYWHLDLELNPETAVNLAKQLKLNEQVLRFLMLKKQ